jgi:glycogen(starch) synthase
MPPPEPRRLRVVLAPSAYYPHVGGIEELTRQLALALQARGHAVEILTNRWPAGVSGSEVLHGLRITRQPFPLPAANAASAARFVATAPSAALRVARYVRRFQPDIVHAVGAGPQAVYLAALTRVLGSRLVFTAQGELTFDAHAAFERSVSLRVGLRWLLARAEVVTACSGFVMRDLANFHAITGETYVIPNGVQPGEFDGLPPERDLGTYVLAVGRLVPQKGFDILIDAFASENLAGLKLVLAGDGFEREPLAARAAALGLGSRVLFLGSVDRARLGRLLTGARVFAFPSRGEAFGIALLEAMAAGVPAVAAAAGGVPEFARDGKNALLVQAEHPSALAEAIARLAYDSTLRDSLVRGGKTTAAELAWSRLASRYEDAYLVAVDRARA